MYLNSVQLKGYLGSNAELKFTGTGKAVTTLSVATKSSSGSGDSRTSYTVWHKVVLWGKRAEAAADLKKGAYVFVQGELRPCETKARPARSARTRS